MDELIPMAMAGSARRNTPLVDPLFEGLDGTPESRLLGAAALAGLAALAGQKPRCARPLAPDLESDPRRVAGTRHLQLILDGGYRALLPEWLALVQQYQKRVEPCQLPRLLEVAAQDRSLRGAVAAAGGPRALWLARQNADWAFLLGQSEDESTWETGQRAVRLEWLGRLRRRDPVRARQLLMASWAEESADLRQKALQALDEGLSLADEDFLESVLDDRSKSVRAEAAELLARLPQSRLAQRARARMGDWVHWKTTSSCRTERLDITPPVECTREMQRDGIELKPPQGVGEKAWWLEQSVARTPLDFWPPGTLKAADGHDWGEALGRGWLRAARAQRDVDWARALIEAGSLDDGLFSILPHAQQEEILQKDFHPNWLVLHQPYSPCLAAGLLPALRARQPKEHDWTWTNLLTEVALRLPPDTPVEEGWFSTDSAVEKLIATVNFRQSMNQEMRS